MGRLKWGLLLSALLFATTRASAQSQTPPPPRSSVEAGIAATRSLGDAFAAVAERASQSVVSIRVEARIPSDGSLFERFGIPVPPSEDGFAHGGGSGIVLREDGYILTNNHVVSIATRVEVLLQDGRKFEARVVGSDAASDLAVLRIPVRGLVPVRFGQSSSVRVGEWVLAIGSPFGLDHTVTAGVISAIGRSGLGGSEIEDYLQTDASINPGNSGGPLVNLDGEVIGVNTMIAGRGTGIGFAVAADLVRRVGAQLIERGSVRRPYIGITFQPLEPEVAVQLGATRAQRGALVSEVARGGPAARAGVRPGDIVTTIDGAHVADGYALLREILRREVGARLRLGLLRNGESSTIDVVTTARPPPPREEVGAGAVHPSNGRGPIGVGLTADVVPSAMRRQL
ncbi:MAG: trypsin-like peptidase domain-containing protein, partial [Polyangiaceae bacterium]|nr:trypsin-like peptidase domain-containing protein [Polyangiaceae bacterium]